MAHGFAALRLAGLLLTTALLALGCSSLATRQGFYQPITAELRSGNAASAQQMLESARDKGKYAEKDRLLYFIDAGLLAHYAGDFQTSNEKLHVAEEAAEELFTKSVSRAAASLLLNDNVLEYSGEDYEILYTNLIKALNFAAMGQFEGAFVEVRRANLKLELLEQKYAEAAVEFDQGLAKDTNKIEIEYDLPKMRFHNDALARYLSMHMYAAVGKYDDARIDRDYLDDAFRLQSHIYDFPTPEVKYRSDTAAILSIVALVGLAPTKEAISLRIRTDKDLGLVQVLYDDPAMAGAEYGHLPINVKADYYFKFALPTIVPRPSQVAQVEVLVDDRPVGVLQLIEDVAAVARETFEARKTLIYIRSVARAVVKGLVAHKLKKKADTGGLSGWLKKAAIDVGSDFLENADLRSVQYLPGRVLVGDFETAPGRHQVVLRYLSSDGAEIERTNHGEFEVMAQGWNLIETSAPY
jgi:hypothetical protein